jgi:hypothetical protein
VATREAQKVLEAACPGLAQAFQVTQDVIRAYLAVAVPIEAMRREDQRVSEISKRIAAMSVGEIERFQGGTPQSIRMRFKTARQLLGEPEATWRSWVEGADVCVQRMPDNAPRTYPVSPITREIASIPLGSAKHLKSTSTCRGLSANYKVGARKLLSEPKADWRFKTTEKGVLCRRIA